jgi:hypothetical protein
MEGVLDALETLSSDLGESELSDVLSEERIRSIYSEWCHEYQKEMDDSRFTIFSENFLKMEALVIENGKTMQLHELVDRTEEEYMPLNTNKVIKELADATIEEMVVTDEETKSVGEIEALKTIEIIGEESEA